MLMNTKQSTIKTQVTDAFSSLALELLREYDSHTSACYLLVLRITGDHSAHMLVSFMPFLFFLVVSY